MKAANRFECRWTVSVLLDVLEGTAESLCLEVPGPDAVGTEFRVVVHGVAVWHQVKRQRLGGAWNVLRLQADAGLATWWEKLRRGDRFVFVSGTSADELHELVERASAAESWAVYSEHFLGKNLQVAFERLRRCWGSPPEEAVYHGLQRLEVVLVDEKRLVAENERRIGALVTEGSAVAAALLEQFVTDSLHQSLTAEATWAMFAAHGIRSKMPPGGPVIASLGGPLQPSFAAQTDRRIVMPEMVRVADAEEADLPTLLASVEALVGSARHVLDTTPPESWSLWVELDIAVDSLSPQLHAARPNIQATTALFGEIISILRQIDPPGSPTAEAILDEAARLGSEADPVADARHARIVIQEILDHAVDHIATEGPHSVISEVMARARQGAKAGRAAAMEDLERRVQGFVAGLPGAVIDGAWFSASALAAISVQLAASDPRLSAGGGLIVIVLRFVISAYRRR